MIADGGATSHLLLLVRPVLDRWPRSAGRSVFSTKPRLASYLRGGTKQVVELALEQTELSPRELAVRFTGTLERALTASGCNQAHARHRPRLLSDNGLSYISGDLADWLNTQEKSLFPSPGTSTPIGTSYINRLVIPVV